MFADKKTSDLPRHEAERFRTLDALRGIAALFVVMHHFPQFFGGWHPPLASSAVDFFFVLSGFVLAAAYGDRVANGGAANHLTIMRLIRLYPLYLIGTLIGVSSLVISLMSRGLVSDFHLAFWKAVPFALLMIPSPGFGTMGNVFPLNIPAWSLFYEMVANIIWFIVGRYCSRILLLCVIIVSGFGLYYFRYDLDGGWNHDTFHIGFIRVAYSFSLGLALFSVRNCVNHSYLPSGIWFAFVFAVAMLAAPEALRLFAVLFFYPTIVILAARSFVGDRSARVADFLGSLSYPMYAVHMPVLGIVVAAMQKLGYVNPHAVFSVLIIVGLIIFCLALDYYYDRPIRSRLVEICLWKNRVVL